jgi:hypothetical protein
MPLQTSLNHRSAARAILPLIILVTALPAFSADSPSSAPAATITVTGTQPQSASQPAEEESDIQIVQALDTPVNLKVTDTPILEVLQKLAQEVAVPIEMEPGTLDLLPYGSKTALSATVEQRPLRETLTELLRPLGLAFVPDADSITAMPTAPLWRIARRATWEELGLLDRLSSTPWSKELADSLQFQFQDARAGYADANRGRLLEAANGVGAGTAAEVLEHACDKYEWAWVPSGEVITIMSKTRVIERLLKKKVTVNYVQASLEQALLDLARRAGVVLQIEPGALAGVPAQMSERFSLTIEDATVWTALQLVGGHTGLSFTIEPFGVRVSASNIAIPAQGGTDAAATEAAMRAMRSNPIVGQVNITGPDSLSYSFFIREEDLPPEVNQMRKAKIQKTINQLRQALAGEQQKD